MDQPPEPAPPPAPGRPTMKMVAERAGVSVATVSFVLSGRTGVPSPASPVTTQRIKQVAAELGYRTNLAARAVRTGRSGLVLLSLTQLSDPWSQSVSQATNAALAAGAPGVQPLVLADGSWIDVLDGHPFDAAFVDHAEAADLPRLRRLVERGLRLVVFSDDLEPEGFDVIRSPQRPGCQLATDHLARHHRRIGCLTASDPDRPGWHRETAYLDSLRQAGLTHHPEDLQWYARDQASAHRAALRLLDRPDHPSAVFATSDFAAMAVVHTALGLGLSVPGDVAVIGVGNTSEGLTMVPALSSVGPPDFFTPVAELLVRAATSRSHRPARHDFDWQLHLRETTRATTAP